MTALALALMLAQSNPPEEGVAPFFRARAGVWAGSGFEFEATRPDSTKVDLDEPGYFSAGADLGVEISGRIVTWASYEGTGSDEVFANVGGVYLGYRDRAGPKAPPGVPHEATAYIGGLWGTFEVDTEDFGDFDDAYGFAAGLELTWYASRTVAASLIGEYRLMHFDYEEPVTAGDEQVGGSTVWAGLGVDLRF